MTADVKPNLLLDKADQPKVEHITLKVKGPQGDDVEFKIKKTTVLGKVFTAYADKLGVNKTGYRFEFDGERLTEMDTPGKFDMEDGDTEGVQHINLKVLGSDGNEIGESVQLASLPYNADLYLLFASFICHPPSPHLQWHQTFSHRPLRLGTVAFAKKKAFKIKRSTQLSKLMEAYSNKTGVDSKSIRFLLDGVRLNPTDTPDSNYSRMTTANANTPSALPNTGRAFVKAVLSGDSVVLRGRPVNGPPPERILSFANIVAPRLGTAADPSKEEAGAFESREFLRKLLTGKEVAFKVEYTTTTNNRDFGSLTLAPPGVEGETNVARLLVKNGWVKVKAADGKRAPSDEQTALFELEAAAQVGSLGVWSPKITAREVSFSVTDGRAILDAHKGKPLDGIVDQVRDANTIRVVITIPSPTDASKKLHQYINVNLTGIKAPVYRVNAPNIEDLIEPFSQEAKYFVESRLLQRDVSVVLEGVSPNGTFNASLIHKVGGSIAEALLMEGYASVVSWQAAMVSGGADKLKAAEAKAKEKKLRLWKSFVAKPVGAKGASLTDYDAIVTRINGADSISVVPVSKPNSPERKLFLASVRGPPKGGSLESGYNHEAKEYLRQRLIGKTVHVTIDFVKPKEGNFDERDCATITLGETNISEALIARGLATALKHRKDDDNRAHNYDALLVAEDKAIKAAKGIHSDKEPPVYRMVDASESATKAKSFLSALQRNKTVSGVVEFASSGSRFKVWLPSQNIKITLVLGGVRTPKAARQNPNGKEGAEKSEPFGQEALDFANRRALQRDVEVSIESIDKVGGFIGSLNVPAVGAAPSTVPGAGTRSASTENFAVLLLEHGFATVHDYSASQSPQGSQLYAAEKRAQDKRTGIWSIRDPVEEARAKEAAAAASIGHDDESKEVVKEVYVSEIGNAGEIHIQTIGPDLDRLEKVMADFASYHKNSHPSLSTGPKVNDIVSGKFTADDQWYRARVREFQPDTKTYLVTFIDYGNSEPLPLSRLRALPPQFNTQHLPAQSREARLAFLTVPASGEEGGDAAYDRLREDMEGRKLVARIVGGGRTATDAVHVVLSVPAKEGGSSSSASSGGELLNLSLVADGVAYLDRAVVKQHEENVRNAGSGPKSLKKEILAGLVLAQEAARKSRFGVWRYGDFRDDE
ncbi:hypothetical protein CcCBS67573_g01422 [Chytriomyces confervae]|uniref:Uncharacterized protein n=1 Tax=Chytriomyces confervae TaxID=246404 RepID=A0A507FNZ5_9FUNG|nr:hypothetical protein CcCBS67573_g01422 [Chytriomyces confervae]